MITPSQHDNIDKEIDDLSPLGREAMRAQAEALLEGQRAAFGSRALTAEEMQTRTLAIECLVRLNAKENGGGWFYRTRRRFQINHQYRA
jgi:hypothetical protein